MKALHGFFFLMFTLSIVLSAAGCSALRHEDVPAHDDVLLYELPYDLTYLRTLEALEKVPDWELEETEKEKGIIRARNMDFSNFADADQRAATILVKRVGRRQTSVALAEYSQRVVGGDRLLQSISEYVGAELEPRTTSV